MALRDWYTCVVGLDGRTHPALKGDRLCFRIPRIDPGTPGGVPGKPGVEPPPFITHPALSGADVHHLQVLATIDSLAGQLPETMSQHIQEAVVGHMQDFNRKLGDGVGITHHDHAAARHAAE